MTLAPYLTLQQSRSRVREGYRTIRRHTDHTPLQSFLAYIKNRVHRLGQVPKKFLKVYIGFYVRILLVMTAPFLVLFWVLKLVRDC